MSKKVHLAEEARTKLLKGIETLTNAVRVTLGPKGRNVVLQNQFGPPTITNDGVTIAKEISLEDPVENMGAALIKEVASKANENAGDGTSTASILAYAIIKEGLRNIAAGANPMILKKGISKAVECVVKELKASSIPVTKNEEITSVASISAQCEEIGGLIAHAMEKVGKEGVITVEESPTLGMEVNIVEGMKFDRGYVAPHMVTDNERMEAVYADPAILVTDAKISSLKDLVPVMELLIKANKKDLVIICESMEGEALTIAIVNKLKGAFNTLVIKAPEHGDRKKSVLEDIATLTGATLISGELGHKLESVELGQLGSARRVISTKDTTTIIEGRGVKEDIELRIKEINAVITASKSNYEKEQLKTRLARLAGGVAIIKIGAASEVEMGDKKLRIEDALAATRCAVEEGIVPGGGVALVDASKALDSLKAEGDEEIGIDIVRRALSHPLRQIAENAGKEGAVILNAVKCYKKGHGYDALTDTIDVDMIKAGIVDPTKVTRTALQNGASVAALFLTTEACVSKIPEEKVQQLPMRP